MLLSLFLPRSAVLVAGCQIPSSLQESRTSLECVKRGEVMGRLVLWTPRGGTGHPQGLLGGEGLFQQLSWGQGMSESCCTEAWPPLPLRAPKSSSILENLTLHLVKSCSVPRGLAFKC